MQPEKDRWQTFLEKQLQTIESLKKEAIITIYGSYQPAQERELLLSVKQKLIEDGYKKTVLVEDRQKEGDDPLEVSKMCLLYSDINFLIFTRQGKRHGLIRELAFIAESDEMIEKIQRCTVFDQIEEGKTSIPELTLSDIKHTGIDLRTFGNRFELYNAILTKAFWHLRRLSKIIQRRLIIQEENPP